MMKTAILVVDDDRTQRRVLSRIIGEHLSMPCYEAGHGQEAIEILSVRGDIGAVILDLEMPVMTGVELLSVLRQRYEALPVIVLTANEKAQDIVAVMKQGVHDFLIKPVMPEKLMLSVRNALKLSNVNAELSRMNRKAHGALLFSDLIGYEGGLSECVAVGRKAAQSGIPVLIEGETGTGKDVFARAIHWESARSENPFIAVNCGAIPEKLVESTLFGHEKGAFTGAVGKALGKFREADGGTLFLDEVGELPMEAQVKLLRALQQKEVEPVGAGKAVSVDVRVISATNRDLVQDVREGRFREDLYFRLNILQIRLPSLRERLNDLERLLEHFIHVFCLSHGTEKKCLDAQAYQRLRGYHWPGNVRELENLVNRAMVLSEGDTLYVDDFHLGSYAGGSSPDVWANGVSLFDDEGIFRSLKALEREVVAKALQYCGGNVTKTAQVLGIAKSTLYAKMSQD